MPRLILNADDYGYTEGINQAILELYRGGALTSTTLMAGGSAIEDALLRLSPLSSTRRTAGGELGVGCHVVLVDGSPLSAAEAVPSLLSSTVAFGAPAVFRPGLAAFVADLTRGRIFEADIEREAIAQIRTLQRRGVHITHFDTHKHTHMFPRVLRPLLRAALQCGVRAVRNPFEPAWSVAASKGASLLRHLEVGVLARFGPTFLRLVEQAGLHTTDGAIGVKLTGVLDQERLERLLKEAEGARAPTRSGYNREPVWELVCHPGYDDQALRTSRTRLRAERDRERTALLAAVPRLAHFSLVHFDELP